MKLVIDIPEEDCQRIKEYYEKNDTVEATYSYIVNGIPLEKIKAEIKDLHNSHMIHLIDADGAVDTCLDIIDRVISELKGENISEQADTEFNHESFYEFLLNVINPNEMEKYRSMFLSSGEIVNGE